MVESDYNKQKTNLIKNKKIYIAGHLGMVGSSILRKLKEKGYSNFILKSSSELDLTNQLALKIL